MLFLIWCPLSDKYRNIPNFELLRKAELTKARVDEAVPAAAAAPQQPLSTDAGGEAESGAEQTHQHVAHADVQQQHVHRCPQLFEFAKQQQHNEVVQEAESHDEAQHHGQHHKARRGELRRARRRVQQLSVIAQVEAVIQTSLARKHAAVHSVHQFLFTLELASLGSAGHIAQLESLRV